LNGYRDQATFFRAALLLGLVPGDAIIRWADDIILRDDAAPAALFDVTLTPTGDLTAMRDAIQPMADDRESPGIARAVLALAHADLAAGRRNVSDTVRVMMQVRRLVAVPDEYRLELFTTEGQFMLAEVGMADMHAIEARLREWLAQFAGAEGAFVSGATSANSQPSAAS
jgi:hypothetical protein